MATPSPSSRRSPRLTGLHHTPPAKASSSAARGIGGGSSTGDKTTRTRTPSPRRKHYGKKSPDSDRVIPFLAVSTPRKNSRSKTNSSAKEGQKQMATAAGGRRRRGAVTISPR